MIKVLHTWYIIISIDVLLLSLLKLLSEVLSLKGRAMKAGPHAGNLNPYQSIKIAIVFTWNPVPQVQELREAE